MNNKKFRKLEYSNNGVCYLIEEDLVGWYLIVYNKYSNESSKDYLFDTLEGAMFEAEDKYKIQENSWREV